MFENENRKIYDTRQNVLRYYSSLFQEAKRGYMDSLERLIAFTSLNNYRYILRCESGTVRVCDDYTIEGLHQRFGLENTTRLLDLIQEVNDAFDFMQEKYIAYFIKSRDLGF